MKTKKDIFNFHTILDEISISDYIDHKKVRSKFYNYNFNKKIWPF